MSDWTSKDGVANSSEEYNRLCDLVTQLIVGDAHMIVGGRADRTARLIVSHLAAEGLVPSEKRVIRLPMIPADAEFTDEELLGLARGMVEALRVPAISDE